MGAVRKRGKSHPKAPAVSVVMPVHNAMPHLDEAVGSILAQTFPDFEFVILDDASTDGSLARLRYWASQDARIRLLEVGEKLGPALSSEKVAREARSRIVARMDADDVSHPERLAEQLQVLESNPDAGLVACLSGVIDGQGRKVREGEPWRLTRKSAAVPFAHGAITYRREVFERIGGYRRECEFWEDQDLIVRMAAISRVLVIPRVLYQVRLWQRSTRAASDQDRLEEGFDRAYRSMQRLERDERSDAAPGGGAGTGPKIDPRAFIAAGSVVLWSGGKPRLFRRLLKRGDLSLDVRTAGALLWTSWASLSPRSLRLFLQLRLTGRNLIALTKLSADDPVAWSPWERRR
jgi:hypothetical protein